MLKESQKLININSIKDNNHKAKTNLTARPFLKWAGGKGQLLPKFQELYPEELKQKKIKTYYEPFVGSGAVFFDIAQNYEIQSAYLYDINEELILTYKVIKKEVEQLIDCLNKHSLAYLKLDKQKRSEYFYEQRQNFNFQRYHIDFLVYSENWVQRAAQTIFLNKTCFNGLFRFNSKGDFNTPVGEYNNPRILDAENLVAVSKILGIAEIRKANFTEMNDQLKSNSFVYFDPPYRPISKTSNFTSYSKSDFTDTQQMQLANLFKYLDRKGTKVMLSNSDPKNIDPNDNFFDELYKDYHIIRIPAKRVINSNTSKRGEINEIVVRNY